MSKKRYENKTFYDPGRFRYALTFFQREITESSSGGQSQTWVQLRTVRAVREAIPKRLNIEGYLQQDSGSSDMYDMWHYIIRKGSFVPTKSMVISVGSDIYTIRAIIEVDEPSNYLKIQAVKTDMNLTT